MMAASFSHIVQGMIQCIMGILGNQCLVAEISLDMHTLSEHLAEIEFAKFS